MHLPVSMNNQKFVGNKYVNMSSLRFLSLRTVLDIAQDGSSQNLRTIKLQKEQVKI